MREASPNEGGGPAAPTRETLKWIIDTCEMARRLEKKIANARGFAVNNRDCLAAHPPANARRNHAPAPPPSFWVELTAEDPENPGRYAWKRVDYIDHEWTDRDPEIASPEGEYSAIEANARSGMAGDKVQVHFYGYDTAGKPRYLFGQTALPFLAVILPEGPEGHRFPYSDIRYWAQRVQVMQRQPPYPPEDPHDLLTKVVFVGEPFPLQNLMDIYRSFSVNDTAPINTSGLNLGSVRALQPGHFVRVWPEIDDKGMVRYFCSESPWQVCIAWATAVADGDFAGKPGWYTGRWELASSETSPVSPPTTSTTHADILNYRDSLWPADDATKGRMLIFNLAQLHDIDGDRKLDLPCHLIGYPAGYTDEDPPRRIILVDSRSAPSVTMTATQTAGSSYGSTEQNMLNALKADVQAIITSLKDAKLMR